MRVGVARSDRSMGMRVTIRERTLTVNVLASPGLVRRVCLEWPHATVRPAHTPRTGGGRAGAARRGPRADVAAGQAQPRLLDRGSHRAGPRPRARAEPRKWAADGRRAEPLRRGSPAQ